MGQFKFFLIVCSAFLIGCATPAPAPRGYEYFQKGLFTNSDGEVYLSTMEPTNLAHLLSAPSDTAEIDTAKQIRDYFCQATSQKRTLRYNLKLVMPKIDKGIPVDEASQILAGRMSLSRTFIKHFFVMAASKGPYLDLNLAIKSSERARASKDLISSGKAERIRALSSDHYLNSSESVNGLIPRVISSHGYSSRKLIRSSINDDILFIFIPKDNTFLVLTNTLVYKTATRDTLRYKTLMGQHDSENFVSRWNSKLESINSSIKSFGRANGESTGYTTGLSPSKIQREIDSNSSLYGKESGNHRGFLVLTDENGEVTVKSNPVRVIQQLTDASQFELSILARNYYLMLPEKTQVELFGNNRYGLRGKDTVIKQVIEDSEEAWGHYLAASTTFKESPTDDPQVYNFQIELGLDNFCKYGRAKDDLLSN